MPPRRRTRRRPDNPPASQPADVVRARPSAIRVTRFWRSPLPPLQHLREYESIAPGAAERILADASKQLEPGRRIETTIVNSNSRRAYLGLAAAFILSVMLIGGGIYLIDRGHDWSGVTIIGMNVVGLAGAFLRAAQERRAQWGRAEEESSRWRHR